MAYSAEDYAGAFRALLPRGRIWQAEPGSTQQRLIAALAKAWSRLDSTAGALLDSSLPGSNLDLVGEWEATLGLPDPCAGANATLEQRAAQVVSRFVAGGGQSTSFFVSFAAALGFGISITTIATFRADVSTVETPLYEEDWLFVWVVTVTSNSSGLSNDVLLCELNSLKPAHTYVLIS